MNRELTKFELESARNAILSVFHNYLISDDYDADNILERSNNICAALNNPEISLLDAYKAVYDAITPNGVHFGVDDKSFRTFLSSRIIAVFLIKIDLK